MGLQRQERGQEGQKLQEHRVKWIIRSVVITVTDQRCFTRRWASHAKSVPSTSYLSARSTVKGLEELTSGLLRPLPKPWFWNLKNTPEHLGNIGNKLGQVLNDSLLCARHLEIRRTREHLLSVSSQARGKKWKATVIALYDDGCRRRQQSQKSLAWGSEEGYRRPTWKDE